MITVVIDCYTVVKISIQSDIVVIVMMTMMGKFPIIVL